MTSTSIDLQTACRMGQIEAIKTSYNENRSKLNEKDPSVIFKQLGWCPLYRTVISGNYEATEFLLSEGADPNNPNNLGETPLHQAADNSQYSIAELLLSQKADPNFQQNDGDSPLHHAAFRGDQKMVQILLAANADPNLMNYMFGRTPLHYAVDCGHLECVQIMLRFGADTSLRDKQGKNARDLSGNNEITKVIDEFSRVYADEASASPIGEVTTYFVSEASEGVKKNETSPNIPLRCSVVSPITEKSSVQLYPIFYWLEKYKLEDYYEVLVEAGYEDVQIMVNQMKSPLPISDKNLREIGICRPGHRRLMVIKLEEEAGFPKRVMHSFKERNSSLLQCCELSSSTRNFSVPKLMEWLEEMDLSHLYALFLESGFDSYENLLEIQSSSYPLTNRQLELEVKIKDAKARTQVLARLALDVKHYSENSRFLFDEPKRVVCDSCVIV